MENRGFFIVFIFNFILFFFGILMGLLCIDDDFFKNSVMCLFFNGLIFNIIFSI